MNGLLLLCQGSVLQCPLQFREKRLEKLLDTPARISYKYEGVSPAGSHKPNSVVPQVWYNAQEGVKKVVTETGAGQWGNSLAFDCSLFGLDCEVRRFNLGLLVHGIKLNLVCIIIAVISNQLVAKKQSI